MRRPTRITSTRPLWLLALTPALLAVLVSTTTPAAVSESEILAGSVIELRETATSGSYQALEITLVTQDGRTALTAVKDGMTRRVELPAAESLALWKALLALGVEELADSSPPRVPPDHSRFTVSIRTPTTQHTFTVDGVDDHPDRRYRAIVREILHLTDALAYGRAWQK